MVIQQKTMGSAKSLLALLLLCSFPAAGFAQASRLISSAPPSQTASKPAPIDKGGVLLLIRQILGVLDLSNKSGNYTLFRDISAPGFAAINDSARLSQSFKNLRETGVDLSGALIFEPVFTVAPEITKDGLLRFGGFFPSISNKITFEMLFSPINGQWKIFGLGVDVVPIGPVAPTPAPPATPSTVGQKK